MMDEITIRAITDTLHAYTADRDAMSRASNGSVFSANSGSGLSAIVKFTNMTSTHTNTLMREFPRMNLTELQALSELIGVALANQRMYQQKGN